MNIVDDHFARARQFRHFRMHDPDRTRSDDQHGVARPCASFFIRVVDAGHRFHERRGGERHMVGDRKDIALLHGEGREAHEFGKGPVLMDAERPVSGIEVPLPRHGQPRGDGVVVRRHAHALTHFIPADTRAHPIDGSGHFVPDDQRRLGRSEGMPVLQHPDVGSTHAGAAGAQHQFPRSGFGYWQVLDAQVVGAVKAGGFHAPQSYTTERLVTNDRCRRIIILRRRGDAGCRMTT